MKDYGAIAVNEYLTVQEAALLIGYSTRSIRDLLNKNLIDYYRPERKILIKKADLYGYIEQFKINSIKTL